MEIKYISTQNLKPYENNPRINDDAVAFVANSISEFGFKVPIVIDKNKEVICGHTRLKAALQLDMEAVPCVIAEDLTEEQVKAFRLVDNKTQELAEWDWGIVFDELDLIETVDMNKVGFEQFLEEDDGELRERKLGDGEEIDLDSFADEEFDQVCPHCGFRFND